MKRQMTLAAKLLTVVASFAVMLCIGGVYAWSIFASELITGYGLSSTQTQIVFGLLIAVFPVTMIFAGRLEKLIGVRGVVFLSALFMGSGYLLASFSDANIYILLLGIGVLAGTGTGFGYLAALTTPVKCFPEKKGMITGIASAGFGLAAVLLSSVVEKMLISGIDVFMVFRYMAGAYFFLIFIFSFFMKSPGSNLQLPGLSVRLLFKTPRFYLLFAGIFLGTFAGLTVVGNLKPMGAVYSIENHILVIGVSVFAVANFTGRILWGILSDYSGAHHALTAALLFQGIAIILMGIIDLNNYSYLILSAAVGFGFGSNFVLFAKESAQFFGLENLSAVYPYVFLGYALAGLTGPSSGGLIFDITGSYTIAVYICAALCFTGSLLFMISGKPVEPGENPI
ncbi:MAG: MFS transporter [Spirochaetes bacterium]|nr:MFS transporter [Spirochaetota bacterium]